MFKQKRQIKQNTQISVVAPTGGLDGVSPLMGMPEDRCVLLENWFPQPSGLQIRSGYVPFATAAPQNVQNLYTHNTLSGTQRLFAVTSSGVYNISSAGAFPAAAIALTNGSTIGTKISTGANIYLMIVNGVDSLVQFDGTSWSSVATLGAVATNTYNYVANYRQRLFFAVRNSLTVDYLAPNAIAGAPTSYPMGALFQKGGRILALGVWTIDSGVGADDQFAVITDQGEVAVFSGNDPATWTPRGVYTIPRPLGKYCLCNYNGDLLILTEDGILPLSSVVQSTSIERRSLVSDRIKTLFRAAVKDYRLNVGWRMFLNTRDGQLLVNVPASVSGVATPYQFVMNTETKNWCVFTGWAANDFARYGDDVYFAVSTGVQRIFGGSDNGANIVATLLQAYSRLRAQGTKKIELQKLYMSSSGGFTYQLGVSQDFRDPRETTEVAGRPYINPALWGSAIWGSSLFTEGTAYTDDWQTPPDDYSVWKGLYLRVMSRSEDITYFGSDLIVVPGSRL